MIHCNYCNHPFERVIDEGNPGGIIQRPVNKCVGPLDKQTFMPLLPQENLKPEVIETQTLYQCTGCGSTIWVG